MVSGHGQILVAPATLAHRVQGPERACAVVRAGAGARHARARCGARPGSTEVPLPIPIAGDCDRRGNRLRVTATARVGEPASSRHAPYDVEKLSAHDDWRLALKKQAESELIAEAKPAPIARVLQTAPGLGPIPVDRLLPTVVTPRRQPRSRAMIRRRYGLSGGTLVQPWLDTPIRRSKSSNSAGVA